MLIIIAALSKDRIIGYKGKMPWHISSELQHFKRLTMGKPLILGRKTFESFGGKPLPGRPHFILTKDLNYKASNCTVVHSLSESLQRTSVFEDIMIIGGANIYKQFLPIANKMYLSIIPGEYTGDTFFPNWDENIWKCQQVTEETDFTFKIFHNTANNNSLKL